MGLFTLGLFKGALRANYYLAQVAVRGKRPPILHVQAYSDKCKIAMALYKGFFSKSGDYQNRK